ncbi:MAG: hypothetical protein A3J84_08620 [Ignavibacteria bacterium RIFOXYA2_FULL_37_17]|nr:MAG: hypothetical protein A3J84_08620 [Ignavibacteria bacterium RIFOXYA2_FULL_37_17]
MINEADKSLFLLEGAINIFPSNHSLLHSLTFLESINSLRIDGYKTTFSDALKLLIQEGQSELNPVFSYLHSLSLAQKLIRDIASSSHIIKTIHKEITHDIPGVEFIPGEYRKTQSGTVTNSFTKNDSRYIPPPPEEIDSLMHDFENYISSDISYPLVVNAALIHAQFEMIHPFETKNGLVGRILFHLHLLWKKRLSAPVLQISSTLNKKRTEYFDRLEDLEKNNAWESWIKFFLKIIIESAKDTSGIIKNVSDLEQRDYQNILEKGFASTPSLNLFELIFNKPFISLPFITKELGLNKQTANVLLTKFLEEGILEETTGKQRNRIFVYKKLLNILSGSQ